MMTEKTEKKKKTKEREKKKPTSTNYNVNFWGLIDYYGSLSTTHRLMVHFLGQIDITCVVHFLGLRKKVHLHCQSEITEYIYVYTARRLIIANEQMPCQCNQNRWKATL